MSETGWIAAVESLFKSQKQHEGFICFHCGRRYLYLPQHNYREQIEQTINHVNQCPHNPLVREIVRLKALVKTLETELEAARKPKRRAKK